MVDYPARCDACGARLGADAAYCPSCGMPRAAAPSPADQPAPEPSAPVRFLSEEPPIQSPAADLPPPAPARPSMIEPILTAQLQSDEPPAKQQDAAASALPGELPPPPPSYSPPGAFPGTVTAAQVKPAPSSGPIVFEVLLGVFGIYGVGWLVAGKTQTGLILLALSAVWLLVVGASAHATLLLSCCGTVPLNVVFAVISAVMLRNTLHRD